MFYPHPYVVVTTFVQPNGRGLYYIMSHTLVHAQHHNAIFTYKSLPVCA